MVHLSEEKKAVEDGFGNCVSDRVLPSKPKLNRVRAKPSKEVDFNGDGWKALESNVEKAQLT